MSFGFMSPFYSLQIEPYFGFMSGFDWVLNLSSTSPASKLVKTLVLIFNYFLSMDPIFILYIDIKISQISYNLFLFSFLIKNKYKLQSLVNIIIIININFTIFINCGYGYGYMILCTPIRSTPLPICFKIVQCFGFSFHLCFLYIFKFTFSIQKLKGTHEHYLCSIFIINKSFLENLVKDQLT